MAPRSAPACSRGAPHLGQTCPAFCLFFQDKINLDFHIIFFPLLKHNEARPHSCLSVALMSVSERKEPRGARSSAPSPSLRRGSRAGLRG